MSQENDAWIRENFVVGFCNERKPWWAASHGVMGQNMFEGAIPPQRVIDLLAKANAIEAKLFAAYTDTPFPVDNFKAIVIPGMGNHVVGVPSPDYQIHQHLETLYAKIAKMLNGIGVASAGLTQMGARAWVQLEHPANENAAGLKFRPGLLFYGSLDGSLKTSGKRTGVAVVCDNTFAWAITGGSDVSVKHTSRSLDRLEDGGDAYKAISDLAETMGHNIEKAAKTVVTDTQFNAFLDALVPVPNQEGRGKTVAENKRRDIGNLYFADARAATWAGSALGVMQAVNTWNQHNATVKGVSRPERNMDNVLSGKLDIMDRIALETLNRVLVAA